MIWQSPERCQTGRVDLIAEPSTTRYLDQTVPELLARGDCRRGAVALARQFEAHRAIITSFRKSS